MPALKRRTAMYTLFKKIKFGTHENMEAGRIHLPEMTFQFHAHTPGGVGYSRKLFGLHEQVFALGRGD